MAESNQERVLRELDRRYKASRKKLRYRMLCHPLRHAYPSPFRLRKWKELGHSVHVKARTPWGQYITVTLPDDVSVSLRWNGFFEYDLTAFYLRFLRNGMNFIDVGAHVGYFSMLASHAVGSAGRVIAFEPTPSTFDVLAANSRTRNNVTPMNAAVWSEPSTISLNDYGPGFSAYNSVFQARLPDEVRRRINERACSVQAVRIDDYVRDSGCVPDVVKIDVESAEMQVLLGMEKLLSGARPIVSLEVGDMGVPDAPRSRDLVQKILSFDYVAFELLNGCALPHQVRNEYQYENIIFAPAERSDDIAE
jgi:FkbM family methyltransferase